MQKTILLIEDNQDILENTAELLELEDYRVLTTDNGSEGIRLAQLNLPHLIICDIQMRETDGYSVFRALLSDEITRSIPFIFMTAKSENADREKAADIGECDYLVKPFDGQELLDCIRKVLSGG